MKRTCRPRQALILLIVFCGSTAFAQDNLDAYYVFPVSLGFGYSPGTAVSADEIPGRTNEFAGEVRVPIPGLPVVQPLVRFGALSYDSLDPADPARWDHQQWFLNLGAAFAKRLSKEFELGASVQTGGALTRLPALLPSLGQDDGVATTYDFLASVGGSVALNPSYNLHIRIGGTLQFRHNLGQYLNNYATLTDFNGFRFGFGVSGHYRFGSDPDDAQTIRALRFSEVDMPAMFAAMQSYYVDKSFADVLIENTENAPVTDLRVSFAQAGFMDSPTPSATIDELAPGEAATVGLLASFNREVFQTNGTTPLTAEVIATYTFRGKPAEQRITVTYDLHDKTALTWDISDKMGSFITPADSAIRNYTSFIRQAGKDAVIDSASGALQDAMLAYHALIELGVIYQVDPTAPFTSVQSNTQVVDSVSLPRDTLVRLTGDCDDLTALYATMLETIGIETAFITTPGHIYVAFNTRVPARDYLVVHPDRDMLFVIDENIWVPVEITMLGSGDFLDAWRFGINEWDKYEQDPQNRDLILTRDAQSLFRPVGLRETDLGLQYGSARRIADGFKRDFNELSNTILTHVRGLAQERGNKRAYNTLGIYAARLGQYEEAREAFQRASRMDSTYLDPRVNLGSVYFLQGRYLDAVRAFDDAATAVQLSADPDPQIASMVYINLSKAHFELGNYDSAEESYARAAQVNPEGVAEFEYLASAGSSGARASEAASGPPILFVDETAEED